MCHKIKILARAKSGTLSMCNQCKIYHLEFNNVYFEFTKAQLNHFKEYLLTIDLEYWEAKYSCAIIQRKIPIPSQQENLLLMFNKHEIEELKALLLYTENKHLSWLDVYDIDYKFILN
jgi:hypothetical protein